MSRITTPEITLNLTRDLILRMWGTIPESKTFGLVESIRQCAQQPDLIKLGRKKKVVTFSLRSFQIIHDTTADMVLAWQEID